VDLRDLLREILEIKGIVALALFGRDGKLAESLGQPGAIDLGFVGSTVVSSVLAAESLLATLGQGRLSHMLLDYEQGPLLLSALGSYVLVTALDSDQSLGRVRFQIRRYLPQLQAALPQG
jgi:predicted regulator of Ras-like GTPase activity (Roadblock/LC7/MglB family)